MRKLRVLVLTPLGKGGRGGIDRIMDEVRARLFDEPPQDLIVEFAATRGEWSIAFSAPLVMLAALRILGAAGEKPDLVHINLAQDGSTLRKSFLARVTSFAGVPYVIHLHGSRFRTSWERANGRKSAAIKSFFVSATHVLVLGSAWRDYVLSKAPEIAGRIKIFPNATPLAPERGSAGSGADIHILFLGVLSERKGTPILIQALGALKDTPGWRATLAGNGDVKGANAAISALGLSDRVSLPGWVGPDEVRRLLGEGDILVLPSQDENLPMSVIEGMAHGLAVVTTPVGAITDIVAHERTGLLTRPGDAEALEAALRRLIGDSGLRERLGKEARAFHRAHLEIDAYYRRLLDIWRRAARARIA